MRRLVYIPTFLTLVLLLGACTGPLNAEQSMAVACRGYAVTLNALAPFKARMSDEETMTVKITITVVSPICRDAAAGRFDVEGYEAALRTLRSELRVLLVMEKEFKS